MQGRISSSRPSRAFTTSSGSAIMARTIDTVELGSQQGSQRVVWEVAAVGHQLPPLGDLAEEVGHLFLSIRVLVALPRRLLVGVPGDHGIGPGTDLAAVVNVEPEQPGDDDQRHRHGEQLHQVALASTDPRVHLFMDQRADVGFHCQQRRRVKRLLHEPPIGRVLRRIDTDQNTATGIGEAGPVLARPEAGFAKKPFYVLLARDRPPVVGLAGMAQRALLAELGVLAMRVGSEGLREEVEVVGHLVHRVLD